jgi:hypothetical protein
MAKFISQNTTHAISHPALKEAAGGDATFLVQFKPDGDIGVYETESEHVADALDALIASGGLPTVQRLDAPTEKPKK